MRPVPDPPVSLGRRVERAAQAVRSYLRLCPVSSLHGWLTRGSDGRFECLRCGYVECVCDDD